MWWSYGPLPKDVAALDVDNDGDLDLIAIPNDNSKVVALINPGNGQFDDAERVELTEWNGNTYDKLYAHADVGGTRDGIRTLYAWKDGDPTIMQAIEWSAASADVANRVALNTGFGSVQDVVRADIQNKGDESGELIYLTSSSVTIGLGISATISGFSGVLQKVAFADITGVCYCNTRTPPPHILTHHSYRVRFSFHLCLTEHCRAYRMDGKISSRRPTLGFTPSPTSTRAARQATLTLVPRSTLARLGRPGTASSARSRWKTLTATVRLQSQCPPLLTQVLRPRHAAQAITTSTLPTRTAPRRERTSGGVPT